MAIPFTIRRRILWGDSDPAGIVYTPRVFHYALETIEEELSETKKQLLEVEDSKYELNFYFFVQKFFDNILFIKCTCAY